MFHHSRSFRFFSVFALMGLWLLSLAMWPAHASVQLPREVRLILDYLRLELEVEPKVGSISREGDTLILKDVQFLAAKAAKKDDLKDADVRAREIRITGAAEQDGLLTYKRVDVLDLVFLLKSPKEETITITLPRILLAELSVLPKDQARSVKESMAAGQVLASALEIPEVAFSIPGVRPFAWRDIKGTWQGNRRTGEGESFLNLGSLRLPLEELALTNKKEGERNAVILRALGLGTFTLSGGYRDKREWAPDGRLLASSQTRLRVEEAGELSISFDKLALPQALLKAVTGLQRNLHQQGSANTPGQAAPGADILNDPQLAAAIRDLTLNGAEVRWQDFGITRRLLVLLAAGENKATEELIAEYLQQLQMQAGALLPPQVAQQLVRAVSHFLQEPKSFRISVKGRGGQPVSVAGLAMLLVAPQMVFNSLDIEIKANE